MALLNDSDLLSVADLVRHESQIEALASSEDVDLEDKIGLGVQRVRSRIQRDLGGTGFGSVFIRNASERLLNSIVVTESLRDWLVKETLLATYQQISAGRTGDRFNGRIRELTESIRDIRNLLQRVGIGFVHRPIPRPGRAKVEIVSGSAGPMQLVLALTLASGTVEGAGGEDQALQVAPGKSILVGLSDVDAAAAGFHVYAGAPGLPLTRQTTDAIAAPEKWLMPDTGLTDGPPLGDGQRPDYFRTPFNLQARG